MRCKTILFTLFGAGLFGFSGCPQDDPGEYVWLDFRVDHGPGEDESGAHARRPKFCTAGDLLYAVWTDGRDSDERIYFNRSLNGGVSWESVDYPISSDTPAGKTATQPAIACDTGRVAIVWEDDRDGEFGNPGIYANVSTDGGASFLAASIRLTADRFGDWRSLEPRVAVADGVISVVWTDGRHGGYDIYYNVSRDLGQTWLEEEQRLTTAVPGSAYSARPRLAVDGTGGVFVAWVDCRDELSDIYFNRSLAHGEPGSWLAEDLRVDTGDEPGSAMSYAPDIDVSASGVAVAWHDRRNSGGDNGDIFVNAIADLENPVFFAEAARVDTDGPGVSNSLFPDLAFLDGGALGVVWRDERYGVSDILFSRSDDGGATWFAEEVLLDAADESGSHAMDPVLAVGSGGELAVSWPDLRDSSEAEPWEDLYVTTSADGGDSWLEEWRVDDGYAGSARSVYPQLSIHPDDGGLKVLWEDWRAGNPDIYYRSIPFDGPEVSDEE